MRWDHGKSWARSVRVHTIEQMIEQTIEQMMAPRRAGRGSDRSARFMLVPP
jgi:hypothetical protein